MNGAGFIAFIDWGIVIVLFFAALIFLARWRHPDNIHYRKRIHRSLTGRIWAGVKALWDQNFGVSDAIEVDEKVFGDI